VGCWCWLVLLAQYGVNIKALILGFFALCGVVVVLVVGVVVVAWCGRWFMALSLTYKEIVLHQ